jgi:hypothetical protein
LNATSQCGKYVTCGTKQSWKRDIGIKTVGKRRLILKQSGFTLAQILYMAAAIVIVVKKQTVVFLQMMAVIN